MENKTLSHHGIKGMRWGRRRYQNPDGSLTPAGKQRYGDGDSESASSLSDQELRTRINRMQMERQYRELTKVQKSKGRQFVEDVLLNAGKQVATQYAAQYMKQGIDSIFKKVDMKQGADSILNKFKKK